MKKEEKKINRGQTLEEFIESHRKKAGSENDENKEISENKENKTMKNNFKSNTLNTTADMANTNTDTNGSKVENILGGKTMKNRIKETRKAEVEARREAKKAAERKAILDAVETVDLVGTMKEVYKHSNRTERDEEGNAIGNNGGKYLQARVYLNGEWTTVAAETPEELAEIKKNVESGLLQGDGMFHKRIIIDGFPCDCCGKTLGELEEDILEAEKYARAHCKGDPIRDIDIAEQLIDAGYLYLDLEEVRGSDDCRYLLDYEDRYIMTTGGETVADLDDIKSDLFKEDIKTLLVERLEAWIEENTLNPEDEEDDYDDYDDYDEDWDCCDCDDEWDDEEEDY